MKNHKLWWQSSYDRGLDVLLYIWPDIKKKFPDATLSVAYGWDLFDKITAGNPERQQWKQLVSSLLTQEGITHLGRIGKAEMQKEREKCGILAYPTYFTEISMIGALEAQKDGLVPVTMAKGALVETAKKGILVEGEINVPEVLAEYTKQLLGLMGDEHRWEEMSKSCKKFAQDYSWETIAKMWDFTPTKYDTKVTIFTPSVREGWFNIMADNLSKQTYKNFEWIIVDDHEEDRSKIAEKYAKKYNLEIKYLKGKDHKKRTYSLINANNTALQAAKGELFVFLQDFILIQPTAIEELVRESSRHPGDFIAPVDSYYKPKIKPDITNKEDWFNGETDIIGDFMRTNIRVQNQGLREATQISDFEQNFGAVPTSTLRVLGGYYEFFDESLGFDNTEIIYRAKHFGYKVWIDEWNHCVCIDHMATLGKDENGKSVNRHRRLNDPRYVWMERQLQLGKLPWSRTKEIDDTIDLQYTIPEEIPDDKCVEWMRKETPNIVSSWGDL